MTRGARGEERGVTHQAPLSMEFSRQEYWSGLPFASPGEDFSGTRLSLPAPTSYEGIVCTQRSAVFPRRPWWAPCWGLDKILVHEGWPAFSLELPDTWLRQMQLKGTQHSTHSPDSGPERPQPTPPLS